MNDQLRQQMFRELEQKDILEQVKEYSYQYLDEIMARRVFPAEESLKNLAKFFSTHWYFLIDLVSTSCH